jgi:hypothetical protein
VPKARFLQIGLLAHHYLSQDPRPTSA